MILSELTKGITEFVTNPAVILVGTITLFEVTPIKINPWKAIFRWVGNAINGDLIKDMEHLKEDVATIKKDQEEDNAENMRCRILSFARSCQKHDIHDAEEWNNIISQLRKYEAYVEERGIENGVIEETAKFLRELYHERMVKDDFEQEKKKA